MMQYVSTRGQSPAQSFSQILLAGLAPDGGLYVPKHYPKLGVDDLGAMRGMNYRELAFAVLSLFADDIPAEDLRDLINKSYTPEIFAYVRPDESAADITPLRALAPDLYLLGLSNGPTLAFKDMAMQLLGNLFEYALAQHNTCLNIVGATSGDTGSAAEYAMRGKRGIKVFMLSPYGKMSRFQTAQMYSLQDDNVLNIAVNGVFDEAQDMVKAISNDLDFKSEHHIGAVNSINWGRIAAQVVYYFKAYFAATKNNAQQVSFAVPSGNFGNVCAGHIARMMGLPIRKLVVATNENDVLDEFFTTGRYRPRPAAQTFHTSSPSMDISKASNFERFAADLFARDATRVCAAWASVEQGAVVDFRADGFFDKVGDYGLVSGSNTHAGRLSTIRTTWEKFGVVIDPHTADGLAVGLSYQEKNVPMIVLETAQAAKFDEIIHEALGRSPQRPSALLGIEDLPQRVIVMDVNVDALKNYIIAHH